MAAVKETDTTASALIKLLDRASAADLSELDQQIADLQTQIDSLLAVRKLVDVKVNGKPERRKGGPRKSAYPSVNGQAAASGSAGGGMMPERRKAVAQLLGKEGPMAAGVIANRLTIPNGSLTAVLACDWFQATNSGYRLTEVGRKESGV